MEITGKIMAIMPARTGVSQRSGNPWTSQDFVLEIPGGEYGPKHLCFTVFGEDKLTQFNICMGDVVTVRFNIDAHNFNGRWYNDVRAHDVVKSSFTPPQSQPMQQARPAAQAQQTQESGNNDLLPF